MNYRSQSIDPTIWISRIQISFDICKRLWQARSEVTVVGVHKQKSIGDVDASPGVFDVYPGPPAVESQSEATTIWIGRALPPFNGALTDAFRSPTSQTGARRPACWAMALPAGGWVEVGGRFGCAVDEPNCLCSLAKMMDDVLSFRITVELSSSAGKHLDSCFGKCPPRQVLDPSGHAHVKPSPSHPYHLAFFVDTATSGGPVAAVRPNGCGVLLGGSSGFEVRQGMVRMSV